MKKLGQKLSFLTKILLVVGLLISNLSSLSIVFAYEASDDLVIELVDNVLEIAYNEQLADEVELVNVKVYENYAYSDVLSEQEVVTNYYLTAEQLLAAKEGTLELTYNSMFNNGDEVVTNFEIFDGTYSAKVEIIDITVYEEEITEDVSVVSEVVEDDVQTVGEDSTELVGTVIASNIYEKEIVHKSGLNIKLFDATTNEEIILVDGKYPISKDSSKVKVVAQVLSGGLNPNDVFEYNNEEYLATDLINKEFSTDVDFNGYLYGEYEIPVEVKLFKPLPVTELEVTEEIEVVSETIDEVPVEVTNSEQYEEVVYTDSITVLYESYEENAEVLNQIVLSLGYDETYFFHGDEKDGSLYVLSGFEEVVEDDTNDGILLANELSEENVVTKTMLDLYNIVKSLVGEDVDDSLITYTLVKDGINVLETYDETTGVTLEDYLATIALDDTVVVTIASDDLTITYNVVIVVDFNGDNLLTEDDLLELIDQTVGVSDIENLNKSDVLMDGEVNTLDVLYLNQVIDSKSWEVYGSNVQATLDASLNVSYNENELSDENYLVSGDMFTVDYIVSLTDYDVRGVAGLFDYDNTLFELVSLKTNYDWIGNYHEGKFLYLGGEVLTKPELEETTPEVETPETEEVYSEEVSVVALEEEDTVESTDYVVLTATFKALKATNEESNNVITLKDIELFNSTEDGSVYYMLDENTVLTENVEVSVSTDNSLQYLEVAGIQIALEDGLYEYEITVDNDVTSVDLKYILGNVAANVTSTVYPEELVEGSNTVVITVTSESGVSQNYVVTVIREKVEETTQVNYNNNYGNYDDDKETEEEVIVTPGTTDEEPVDDKQEESSNLSRIVIIILILIVIAGLVYLIFKDDDIETKKANKDINKLKKEPIVPETKVANKTVDKNADKVENKKTNVKPNTKSNTKSSNNAKNKNSKNKNKER